EMGELIQRTANLVRAGLLENLGLQPDVEAGALAQDARGQHRRLVDVRRDDPARRFEVGARQRRKAHRLNLESSSPSTAALVDTGAPFSMKTIECCDGMSNFFPH